MEFALDQTEWLKEAVLACESTRLFLAPGEVFEALRYVLTLKGEQFPSTQYRVIKVSVSINY